MPNVTSQNLFAVLPSMINIIRGQATSAKITLHKNYVGNPLPVALQNNVMVEYINSDNVVFKTQSINASNLISGTGDLANQISIEIDAIESAALNFSPAGIQGELYVRIYITQTAQTIILPKLKVGNVYDAGDQIGEIVASRFTVPSTVYKIKALDNYASTMPGAGEMVFNSATPSSVTMVKLSNQDDKGYKNQWLESVLADRIGVDGLTNSIFFTNVNNTSEYVLYRISNYVRVNTDGDADDNGLEDAIQLGLIYEGNSTSADLPFEWVAGDSFGIFTESYQGLLSQGIQITTPTHLGGVDGVRELTFTGTSVTSITGQNATDGELTIDIAPGQKGEVGDKGDKGEIGDKGDQGIQGIKGDTGEKGDEGETAYEVYANSMANPYNESDWLNSLIGPKGDSITGEKGDEGDSAYEVYTNTNGGPNPLNPTDWLNSLVGSQGSTGDKGDAGLNGDRYNTVSGSGFSMPNINTTTIEVETDLSLAAGQFVKIAFNASNWQVSEIESYNAVNGELTIKAPTSYVGGPIMQYSWTIVLVGADGDAGSKGEVGTQGAKGSTGGLGNTGLSAYQAYMQNWLNTYGNTNYLSEPDWLASMVGEKGDVGPTGSGGTQGDKGDAGDTGDTGLKGEQGADSQVAGPKGDAGDTGDTGLKGDAGNTGAPGDKGDAGDTGGAGDKGDAGDTGDTGLKGDAGNTGAPGDKGAAGDEGLAGPVGPQGPAGNQGGTGNTGLKGDAGQKGDAGDNGDKGEEGTTGGKGEPGTNGSNGDAGPQGIQGVAGPQGAAGSAGSAGPQGQKGEIGAGTQGDKGDTGSQGSQGQKGADGNGGAGTKGEPGEKGSQGADSQVAGPQGQKGDTGDEGLAGPVGPQGPAGNQGGTGNTGLKGDTGQKGETGEGATGDKGDTGLKGATGDEGGKGEVGEGATGDKGAQGDAGDKGEVGTQGTKGDQGDQGGQGLKGLEGSQGQKGDVGPQGVEGPQGPQGVGQKGDVGPQGAEGPQGPQGNQGGVGPGITLIGNVATTGNLPAGGNTQGDAYIVQADDSMHIWNGSAWIDGGSIQGPQGAQGGQGNQGPTGNTGLKGDPGTQGSGGAKGAQGDEGLAGPVGPQGNQGLKGDVGSLGPDGPQGQKGAQGAQGDGGPQGEKGGQGEQGAKGDEGTQGAKGDEGPQGNIGGQGDKGSTGSEGPNGPEGPDGPGGPQGLVGPTGGTGAKGDTGAGGGTKYLALLQFNSTEAITSITMVDPAANGTYTTSGVTTATSTGANGQKFAEFQFSNEGYAPSSVVVYAADMKNDKYKITALNTAGDNLAHEITGPTMANISGNNYQSNLFSSFSSSTFKIDCSIDNLDYVRDNIPPQFKEAHVYIVFQF